MKVEGNLHQTLFYMLLWGMFILPILLLIPLMLLYKDVSTATSLHAAVLKLGSKYIVMFFVYWICFVLAMLSECLCRTKSYMLDAEGIMIEIPFINYRKRITWGELAFVRLERSTLSCDRSGPLYECLTFSDKKFSKPKLTTAPFYASMHPLHYHYFILYEEPKYPISDILTIDKPSYLVEKQMMMELLRSWDIAVERT